MKLSKQSVEKFKQIYLEEYGIELSDQQAMQKSQSFLKLFKLISQTTSLELIKTIR